MWAFLLRTERQAGLGSSYGLRHPARFAGPGAGLGWAFPASLLLGSVLPSDTLHLTAARATEVPFQAPSAPGLGPGQGFPVLKSCSVGQGWAKAGCVGRSQQHPQSGFFPLLGFVP